MIRERRRILRTPHAGYGILVRRDGVLHLLSWQLPLGGACREPDGSRQSHHLWPPLVQDGTRCLCGGMTWHYQSARRGGSYYARTETA